jgi:hypothetical protein
MDNFDDRRFGDARRFKAVPKAACISREVEDPERGCALLRIRHRGNAASLGFADEEIRGKLTRAEDSSDFDKSTNVAQACLEWVRRPFPKHQERNTSDVSPAGALPCRRS